MEFLSKIVDVNRVFYIAGTNELVFKATGKVHKRVMRSEYVTNWTLNSVRYCIKRYMVDNSSLDITYGCAVANAWFDE